MSLLNSNQCSQNAQSAPYILVFHPPSHQNLEVGDVDWEVKLVCRGLAQLGAKTLRSIGLARAALNLSLKAATYNLRRFVYLKEAGIVAF